MKPNFSNPALFVIALLTLFSCGSDDTGEEPVSELVIYQIDYNTLTFEGGVALSLRRVPGNVINDIPLEVEIEEATAGNDGAVGITYEPTLDRIFLGTLSLNGEGEILFPAFIAPGSFLEIEEPVEFPATVNVQSVGGDHSQVDIAPIWDAIAGLGLTDFVVTDDTRIGLFLYQPSTDSQQAAHWDWILILYNQ
jgi:hypothetical protein